MPTYDDPHHDAQEAYEALRGLAHATGWFEQPARTWEVTGNLLGSVRLLRQSIHQVGEAHLRHINQAFNDAGSRTAGQQDAIHAAGYLHEAATLLDQVEAHLDAASQASGRIAWHTTGTEPAVQTQLVSASAEGSGVSVTSPDLCDPALRPARSKTATQRDWFAHPNQTSPSPVGRGLA